jgi:hypothetical protein
MIEIFYRYRVHPAQVRAFEHAYGPAGRWPKLFRLAMLKLEGLLLGFYDESEEYRAPIDALA